MNTTRSILLAGTLALSFIGLNSCNGKPENTTVTNDTDSTAVVQENTVPTITVSSQPFMFEAEKEWEQTSDKGVTRQIMGYNDNIMMVKVKFEKGACGAAHEHPHTQVTYVASGKFEFTVGNETKTVSAGDAIYMEPNIHHGCKCLEAGMLIDCFSPMRDTFLKK